MRSDAFVEEIALRQHCHLLWNNSPSISSDIAVVKTYTLYLGQLFVVDKHRAVLR